LRQRIPDQADELVRQNERSVVVRLQITKLQGTIAYFGEHAAFIGRVLGERFGNYSDPNRR
jgi:hypothetical protein